MAWREGRGEESSNGPAEDRQPPAPCVGECFRGGCSCRAAVGQRRGAPDPQARVVGPRTEHHFRGAAEAARPSFSGRAAPPPTIVVSAASSRKRQWRRSRRSPVPRVGSSRASLGCYLRWSGEGASRAARGGGGGSGCWKKKGNGVDEGERLGEGGAAGPWLISRPPYDLRFAVMYRNATAMARVTRNRIAITIHWIHTCEWSSESSKPCARRTAAPSAG
jgi:hypothetical protein